MEFSQPLALDKTPIDGLLVVHLSVHGDNRGWFKENWQQEKLTELGLPALFPVQNNISFNATRGVTRGLHAEPWDKYVSVATGSVFGAWCDLRADSLTYGKVFSTHIDPSVAVFVPRGVANGFQALEPTAYTYLVNAHWSPDAQYSFVNLADPALGINWPIDLAHAELSEKDKHHPLLSEAVPVPPRKILVTGANGQLGRSLAAQFPGAEFVSHDELDITKDLTHARQWTDYSAIINAAAFTNVDGAENERARAWETNALAVSELAKIATRYDLTLVQISSDYVFDGTHQTHSEEEPPSPLNVYGASKAAGDIAASTTPKHYIIRTSWVVGTGKNFVGTMANLAARGVAPTVVNDQYGRLTFTQNLSAGIAYLLDHESTCDYGIYNITNEGSTTSWAEIAQYIYKTLGHDPQQVTPVSTAEYYANATVPNPAPRPRYSTLDLHKIEHTGFIPRPWPEALEHYLTTLKEQQ